MPQTLLNQEVAELIEKLYRISNKGKRASQSAFRRAAPILTAAIKGRAPVSKEPHYRYRKGVKIEYRPGNLRRSMKSLTFKRSAAVFVGPRLGRGDNGPFTGNKTDGFYAPFVEYGIGQPPQPFIRPGLAVAGPATLKKMAVELKFEIEKAARAESI